MNAKKALILLLFVKVKFGIDLVLNKKLKEKLYPISLFRNQFRVWSIFIYNLKHYSHRNSTSPKPHVRTAV